MRNGKPREALKLLENWNSNKYFFFSKGKLFKIYFIAKICFLIFKPFAPSEKCIVVFRNEGNQFLALDFFCAGKPLLEIFNNLLGKNDNICFHVFT